MFFLACGSGFQPRGKSIFKQKAKVAEDASHQKIAAPLGPPL
jgi:hypothetical protein